jgi:periplasmic protein TonB
MATTSLDTVFGNPRGTLPSVAVVLAVHALLLLAFTARDRILLPATPRKVLLLASIPPKVIPPPLPQQRARTARAPAREAAAPPLRDIDAVPRTDVVATIADTAMPVAVAGGKPDGHGTAGAGDTGAGVGGADGGKVPVTVRALIDPANCERPKLPEFAERRRLAGDVILALKIDVDGKVSDARIARSSGTPILDQTALESARQCHFVAATIDKVPVPSWEPFRFTWTNR